MAIVLIGDEESDPEIITDGLSRSFPQVHLCKTIHHAARLADNHQTGLIIFFLSSVESAEKTLQSLYGLCHSLSQRYVKMLLLCKGSESRIASQLCEEGIFDDFHIAQPLQDVTQFHWVIKRLLKSNSRNDVLSTEAIEPLKRELNALKKNISEINSLPERVQLHIDSIETTLDKVIDGNMSDVADSKTLSNFIQIINGLREQSLSPSLVSLSKEIESFSKLIESECKQHFMALESSLDASMLMFRSPPSSTKLLVVDDNEGFRHIVHDVLQNEGYKVLAVSSAKKAISLILREQPALVLVDYDMPEVNGIKMIRDMNQLLPKHLLPPFVMVTGYSLKNIVEESADLGVVDFIVKPIRRKTIIEKVKKHLGHEEGES